MYFYHRASTALWYGLKVLPLAPGDTILFPSYHCGIELDVVLKAGFEVKFYRVDSKLAIDMDDLNQALRFQVRALYVIHYFGFPQPIDELKRLCSKNGLILIEDCALTFHTRYQGKPLGSFGDIAVFSMRKTLALPAGGALAINQRNLFFPDTVRPKVLFEILKLAYLVVHRDLVRSWLGIGVAEMYERFQRLLNVISGRTSEEMKSIHANSTLEFSPELENFGMSELSLWLLKVSPYQKVIERRRIHFQHLLNVLSSLNRTAPLIANIQDGVCPLVFPLVVRGDPSVFVQFCKARGVLAEIFWPDLHSRFPVSQYPEAHWLKKNVVSFPLHHHLTAADLVHLGQTLNSWEQEGVKHGLPGNVPGTVQN